MTPVVTLEGFPPVADPDARVLILGSMPGEESLRVRQYYGHKQNQFWDVMGELFGAGRDLPYGARLRRLRARRIALWDVVHRCRRSGSLDSAIEGESVEANDFGGLFAECPFIEAIFFNGRTAEALYDRCVRPALRRPLRDMEAVCLPSTSPANASLGRDAKRDRWVEIRDRLA